MRITRKAVAAAVIAAGLFAGAAACGGSTPSAQPTARVQATTPVAKCWPCTSAPATTSPAAPKLTTAQQQVLEAAESYLTDGQGFSRAGLMDQLTSSCGEGFSYNGLVSQLESPYGEQFTPAQARYGARVALQRG